MNSLYSIYLNTTFKLAKSMIIKLDCFGVAMNRRLSDYGIEVPTDRNGWRYYLHLSGEYHMVDAAMMITSLDDATQIVFNKENMQQHKKTRAVYLYNNQYTNELKAKYPEQTILINGILRPVDIKTAINAVDGTILYHDKTLIESQEHSLLYRVEKFIQGFLYRTEMEALLDAEELFAADLAAKLYAFLPVRILDYRNMAVRTSETHTFHIMAFLASNQHIDEFVPYLTYSQMQYLYRNLLYIQKHTGITSTFNALVKNLLTVRNLPLYEYALRQKDMDVESGEMQPTAIFSRHAMNLASGLTSRDIDEYDIVSVMNKEIPLALDNANSYDECLEETTYEASISQVSNIPTKILEVSAIDPEDTDPIKLPDVLINEWLHQAANGMYSTVMDILNPLNGDVMKLDTKEMFLLYIYASAKGFAGIDMGVIPPFIAKDVLTTSWISKSEYLAVLEEDRFQRWDGDIDFFIDTHPITVNDPVTAAEFYEQANTFMKRQRVRHQFVFQPNRAWQRQGRMAMYNINYRDVVCNLTSEGITTFDEFFLYIGLDRDNLSMDAWKDLAMEALDKATLIGTMDRVSLREIQSAMVRLFTRLSSYSIQFIEEITGTDTIVDNSFNSIPDDTLESVAGEVELKLHAITLDYTTQLELSELSINRPYSTVQSLVSDEKYGFTADLSVTATVDGAVEQTVTLTRVSSSVSFVTIEPLK